MLHSRGLVLALILGVCSCATTPAITVVRISAGDKIENVKGDNVKLKRGPQETYSGARGGFFVVRSMEDWQRAWPNEKAPPMPPTLDTASHMLFLAVSESQEVTNVKVTKSLETAELLYVWVSETKVGQNCVNKSTERAFDAVVAQRADKPVKFIVEEAKGESCGDPPIAGVDCRLKKDQAWSKAIVAQPGDTVEC